MCVGGGMHMCAGGCGGQKRALDPGARVTGCYGATIRGCQELKLSLLHERDTLLANNPFL